MFEQAHSGSLYDEKMRLKQLRFDDDEVLRKYNQNQILEETNLDDGVRESFAGLTGLEKEVRTTEGDDCSYDEPTNCRLREDTNASMMFGMNQNATPVMLS